MDAIVAVVAVLRVVATRGITIARWWTIWRGITGNTVSGWTATKAGHSMSTGRSSIIGMVIEGVSV